MYSSARVQRHSDSHGTGDVGSRTDRLEVEDKAGSDEDRIARPAESSQEAR